MTKLSGILEELRQEREKHRQELGRLDQAISAFQELVKGDGFRSGGRRLNGPPRKRQMSAAGRKRIAAAQRARWAKLRQQKTGTRKT